MGLTKLKQYIRFQFSISINTISGALVDNNDVLHVVWKTHSHKGKLKTHTLKLDNSVSQTQTINLWWQQKINFEDFLCLDVEAKSFDVSPLTFLLKREKNDMTETIGEFKTDLGLCANTVLTESEFSVDVPSQMFDHLKATITVHFKLLEKSSIREMYTVSNDTAGVSSSIQELRQEMARVSNDYLVLKTLVLDSQSFSKADYWVEKLPDMELNLREYTTKVDELNTYVHKILQDTKITVLDDKITDLQAKVFADRDKLKRLSDFYSAFTQSTAQEIAKMREQTRTPTKTLEVREHLGTWSHPPRDNGPKRLSLHAINFNRQSAGSAPVSPRSVTPEPWMYDSSSSNDSPNPRALLPRGPSMANVVLEAEMSSRFVQLDDLRCRLEQAEAETQKLSSRVALTENDAQQLHQTTEALKWEREKDMENFYLFQKSQSQFAEELSKLKLQLSEMQSMPRKLEQRMELLEVYMGKVKRAFAGMKIAGGGSIVAEEKRRSHSSLGIDWRPKQPEDPAATPQPSYAAQASSVLTPPYHWFLLDHCFLFASEGEAGELLVPAYFLVKFCTESLDLADSKEDWSVFDGLFFALHFETKKHAKSPTHLLFWLTNTSFILDQLKENVFPTFKSRAIVPSIMENEKTVVRELESFVKNIYNTLAVLLSQVFETAIKAFSLSNAGDYENEWVLSVLTKLEWLYTLLKSYNLKDSFIQSVLGDMYAVMDTALFNLICSESSLCTPDRANQVKYFLSSLDNWACSDHPTNSKIIDRLSHAREMANLILGPKGNLRESSFRKSLFPHLTDLQIKHLLTIFTSNSASEKLPATLLSDLSAQITYTPGQDDLDHQAIFSSHDFGAFFEAEPDPAEALAMGRFSPPPVADTQAHGGYSVVETTMQEVHDILTGDAYAHWGYLSRELQKWGRNKSEFLIPHKGSSQTDGSFVDLVPDLVNGIQELITQCAN